MSKLQSLHTIATVLCCDVNVDKVYISIINLKVLVEQSPARGTVLISMTIVQLPNKLFFKVTMSEKTCQCQR